MIEAIIGRLLILGLTVGAIMVMIIAYIGSHVAEL